MGDTAATDAGDEAAEAATNRVAHALQGESDDVLFEVVQEAMPTAYPEEQASWVQRLRRGRET